MLDISWICVGHMLDMFRKFVRQGWCMFVLVCVRVGACPGQVWGVFGLCLGDVSAMFGGCFGHVLGKYATFGTCL